ncbi:YwqG family protein [Actinoplanes palleronii]|uniref:DUF1963 domain-containing protein n=1 Tax=Actinoplanes palleronii TaxID=113570 RepID=A0ABQ4B9C3_9ACTN|nr:YwqG family protein [Actinoplanes palleronii]GIE67314.1 hypothetical protein Apa02nite_034220 [Actinoplanes palleronii]
MDYHDRFLRAATEQGVPRGEAVRYADLVLRFRIRAGAGPDGVRAGRFGGLPHLPADIAWPCIRPGVPLPYLAAVDCAALPRIAGFALPAGGSLLFFLSPEAAMSSCSIPEEQQFARVVHVPAGAVTAPTGPPDDDCDDEPLTGPEHDLYARVEPDLPEQPSGLQDQVLGDLPHAAELAALVDRLWPGRVPWIEDDLLLGGYSVSAQNSPEWILAEDSSEEAVQREWVALAQFAVPHQEYVNGRFLIRHEDLAAGRFDQALSFCEFTE